MAKTTRNNSDPVHVRYKDIACGRKSVYLDYMVDGKRKVEYLKMYLQPGTSKEALHHNEFTMKAVMNIKAERLKNFARKKDINQGVTASKMYLLEWIRQYVQGRKTKGVRSAGTCYQPLIKHITDFAPKTRVWEVNHTFVADFVEYMCHKICPRSGKNYGKKTVTDLVDALGVIMKAAVVEGIAKNNPVELMDRSIIQGGEKPRSFLTVEELRTLTATPTVNTRLRRLFLFSCMTGLRYSDLKTLKWSDVIEEDGRMRIEKIMRKTRKALYLPLNATAIELLPPRGAGKDLVFDVPTIVALDKSLKKWVKAARIEKRVSFHTARHSFAVISLELGSDLYTTSKLLGHCDVGSTQVYAEIIDPKREEAVFMIDNLFDDYLQDSINSNHHGKNEEDKHKDTGLYPDTCAQ